MAVNPNRTIMRVMVIFAYTDFVNNVIIYFYMEL
jgi:hypothetical protein